MRFGLALWADSEINRLRGLALLWAALILGAALFFSGALERSIGRAFFDRLQFIFPRAAQAQAVTVVAIDEQALAEIGQWPWPRAQTAALVAAVNAQQPLVVGLDILFAEPDRYSGPRLLEALPELPPGMRQTLLSQTTGDARLAQAMMGGEVVLARAGVNPDPSSGSSLRMEPVPPISRIESVRPDTVPVYAGLLPSVPEVSAAASGHGLVSNNFQDGVVRSMPLLGGVGDDAMMPSLVMAMLQQATRHPEIILERDGEALRRVRLDQLSIPVNADGSFNLHFSSRQGVHRVSAADILKGRVAPDTLKGHYVMIGFTGLALMDFVATPIGERIPGVEVHAQLIDALRSRQWLDRPPGMRMLEGGLLVLGSVLLALMVPARRPASGVLLWVVGSGTLLAGGVQAFHQQYLFDAASVMAMLTLVFGGVLALTLQQADAQRRRLAAALHSEREAAARLEGELAAASRVQMGMLPRASEWPQDPRIELAASMTPARRVGGDLYDLITTDEHSLCFLIGDVSGKGLPASVFMALSKALMKSLALRGQASAAELLTAANREVARDNPEALFVTALAGYLNLDTGELDLACAGHESPTVLPGEGGAPRLLDVPGGPPLCVFDDFPYPCVRVQFRPGDTLVLTTDGIQEAQNESGALYGRERLAECLGRCLPGSTADDILNAVAQMWPNLLRVQKQQTMPLCWCCAGGVRKRPRKKPFNSDRRVRRGRHHESAFLGNTGFLAGAHECGRFAKENGRRAVQSRGAIF